MAGAGKRQSTWTRKDGTVVRRCGKCRKVKKLEQEFYVAERGPDGEVLRRVWTCKRCSSKRTSEIARRHRADPVRGAEERARQAAHMRKWRADNPERYRAALQRRKQRVFKDPKRHEALKETERIRHWLRRERKGKPLYGPQSVREHVMRFRKGPVYDAHPDKRVPHPDGGDCVEIVRPAHVRPGRQLKENVLSHRVGPELPALPLAKALVKAAKRRGESVGDLCRGLGIYDRTVLRWRTEPGAVVREGMADEILTKLHLNWSDVWPPEKFPEVAKRLAA